MPLSLLDSTVQETRRLHGKSGSKPRIVSGNDSRVDDAALRRLDDGELITSPSLKDDALLKNFEAAGQAPLNATQVTDLAAPFVVFFP